MISLYKNLGRWKEDDSYTPGIGDVIFYDWDDSGSGDCTGGADHVGIVTAVSGTSITVIKERRDIHKRSAGRGSEESPHSLYRFH